MRATSTSLAVLILLALPAAAAEHVLPVFALNVPGPDNSLWNSEVYVTNLGAQPVVVHEGALIPGDKADGVPCLPIVQPFIEVAPYSTRRWSSFDLALGIGCPAWAWGAMTFSTQGEVTITSRVVNSRGERPPEVTPLQGFGQEIPAVRVEDLPGPQSRLLLPAAVWHPNSCGPRAFDTNLFITNPGDTPVIVELDLSPRSPDGLVINGVAVDSPYRFEVPPWTQIFMRVAGPDSMLTVCMDPVIGAFSLAADGPLAVIGSVVDRSTEDARTILPVPIEP